MQKNEFIEKLDEAEAEARNFLRRAKVLREEHEQRGGFCDAYPRKAAGALKRSSRELSASLITLRKASCQ